MAILNAKMIGHFFRVGALDAALDDQPGDQSGYWVVQHNSRDLL